jgi:hypothetical protein
VALISALLYTFSFSMIQWDLIAWNPAPFFLYTLVIFYFLLKSLKDIKKLPFLSFLFGLGLHIHLASITLFPFFILPLAINKTQRVKYWFYSFLTFLLAIAPLIIFDFRHNFHNSKQFISFLFQQGNLVGGAKFQFGRVAEMVGNGTFSFLTSELPSKTKDLVLPLLWLSVLAAYLVSSKKIRGILTLIFALGIFTFLFFSIYPGLVLEYYLMIFIPLAIITFSVFLEKVFLHNFLTKFIFLLLAFFFLYFNLSSWLKYDKVLSLKDKDEAVKFIVNDAQGKPFRISLTTALGYDTGYRYLFWYHKANLSTDVKDKVYTIVAPVGVYGIKPFKEFHGVGVLWEEGQ